MESSLVNPIVFLASLEYTLYWRDPIGFQSAGNRKEIYLAHCLDIATYLSRVSLKQAFVVVIPKESLPGSSPAKPSFGTTPTVKSVKTKEIKYFQDMISF